MPTWPLIIETQHYNAVQCILLCTTVHYEAVQCTTVLSVIIAYNGIKLLDFADFAIQAANSRIGPFESQVLNLNHLIHKKSENMQWEKCRYITGREKTFSDTAQYFLLKHQKN